LNDLNIPFVVHFHGYDASQKLNDLDYKKDIKEVFGYAKRIIVASEFIRNRLIFAGCNNDKISIVRLGVDIDKLTKAGLEVQKTSYPSLIHVGRLVEKKNPIILLHTFKKVLEYFPDSILTIIGSGPMYSEVRECIKKFNIQKSVRLISALERNEVLQELSSHWIYTQHCVTGGNGDQEGFSVSILEASFYKLPVVSTLHNGIPENVIDGETGFLVREYDYNAMAEKIIYLLNNKKIMIKMGENGYYRVVSKFNHDRRIDELKGLLSSQLK
jgi:colanic acid/amylovoran biosynthesis glycosyltransferase